MNDMCKQPDIADNYTRTNIKLYSLGHHKFKEIRRNIGLSEIPKQRERERQRYLFCHKSATPNNKFT